LPHASDIPTFNFYYKSLVGEKLTSYCFSVYNVLTSVPYGGDNKKLEYSLPWKSTMGNIYANTFNNTSGTGSDGFTIVTETCERLLLA